MGKNLFNHLNELTHGNNENYFDEFGIIYKKFSEKNLSYLEL